MNPIEKIKNKRAPIRSAVTKLITKIQNYIESNCDDIDNILELQDQLIEKSSEFDTEINRSEEYSEKIVSIKYKIKSYIKRREGNLNVPSSTQVWSGQNRPQLSIKLPEIPYQSFLENMKNGAILKYNLTTLSQQIHNSPQSKNCIISKLH
ncbi:hypothetical protein TNIN_46441 [Trichonephila inaurata madagascariensis]|uniref:Uncharacterized protein n=1 Tax=Trichonephila inaurata madagascariensis TaxID=2747483 RepID=A0A8X6YTA1_9ARAC|nr:hypothetical protein TNIN_46441 [Trichonephila inaurata madagascariensis]